MDQIEQDQRVIFMYAGLPGAGKTTVSKMAADLMGGEQMETGNYARRWAATEGHTTSEAVGEWVAEQRRMQGNAFVEERLVGELLREEIDAEYPLHVDGVRHIDGVNELRDFASTSFLVVVKADFQLRLRRLQERAREDEEDFEDVDLLERDRRELNELGTASIINSNSVDVVLENNYTDLTPLQQEVERMVNDYIAFSNHA